MNEIKIILCVVVGVLLANYITDAEHKYLTKTNTSELNNISENSNKNGESYNGLQKPKINITISNDSENQLECGNMKGSVFNSFLYLERKKERSYENIDEGEYIGCNIKIDSRSSTILNWFHVIIPGVYKLSLEQIECKTCKGINYRWATIVTKPNGEREFQII